MTTSSNTVPPEDIGLPVPERELEAFALAPLPMAILDRFGLIATANEALGQLLGSDALRGEPFLQWLEVASEREGFGRAFSSLREKEAGRGFVSDVHIVPTRDRPHLCRLRCTKLRSSGYLVACETTATSEHPSVTALGVAATRSLDALDEGVLLVDGRGRVMHANPASEKLWGGRRTGHVTGRMAGRITGRNIAELVAPGEVALLAHASSLARAGNWSGELELVTFDGERVPVEVSMAGSDEALVVLVRDLRERRRRAFEARLAAQIDRCLATHVEPREGIMAASAALAGGVGAKAVVMLARTTEGWQCWSADGAPRSCLITGEPPAAWCDDTHPCWMVLRSHELDARDEREQHLLRSLFGPAAMRSKLLRVTLRTATGVAGHLLLELEEQLDARDVELVGQLASQIALGLAAGLKTLESHALAAYRAMVLDQTSVLLDSVDANGRVVTWNRASEALLGVRSEDAVGKRFGVEVAAAMDPARWEALWQALLVDGVVSQPITLQRAGGPLSDGRESAAHGIPLHLEARLVRDEDGIRGAVLVGQDLSERQALEQQILRSQKLAAVGLLAAGIAHEINNPLTGVVGYSQLLLERELEPAVRDRVEKIARSAERCRKIVEGVLLFARQREGGVRRAVDLQALVERVISIGEYQWRMHNVRVLFTHEGRMDVWGDADQLEQVVLNLLSNAVDAMPRGGSTRVSLSRVPGSPGPERLRLVVEDDGHGIAPEILPRIFDPFFSTKEIGKGTGLGLAISYGIVQDHAGEIAVDSAPGQGARFTITLPAHAAHR